jgi:hypothetical protein
MLFQEDGNTMEMPRHFGMPLTQLDDSIWRTIVGIYYEVACEESIEDWKLESSYSADAIHSNGGNEHFRIGSVLNRDSKLYAHTRGDLVSFDFYANHPAHPKDMLGTPEWDKGLEIAEAFRQRVDELLLSIGIAEPLPIR